MYRHLFSVAAFTLLSRATGFFRDVMLGAVLGAGMMADAFYVAFRLPNHFRAIFGEGAFNAAYVPSYSRVLETEGPSQARLFASRIFTMLLASQIVLLAAAWLFMPQFVALLAPGFEAEPEKFELAITLTRITFPYLLFVTLVTLHSGTLNAQRRFAAASFSPVILNLVMMGTLAVAFLFPNAGHAAAWGITISGVLQLVQISVAAWRADALASFSWPKLDADVRQFFKAIVPAVIGSAGVQIALFADTIIASLLPTGSVSAIYYADRIYQLPIGVIGIAAGTVLLPEMSRRFAAGDPGAAYHAQNRTMALTIALTAPFLVAFLTISDLIMRGVFLRGRFTEQAAAESAAVLAAYGLGLMAVVLIRSAVASFQSQGDTRTPMFVSLTAVAVNVLLKFALYKPLGAAGLALATAVGAWINFGLLTVLALRAGSMQPDRTLAKVCGAVLLASAGLAAVAFLGDGPARALAAAFGHFVTEVHLAVLSVAGMVAYAMVLMIALRLLGVRLARVKRPPPAEPAAAP
jgi:putative peptidoglycan lipid II flippase